MPNNITYGSFQFPEISNCGLLYLCRFVCVVEKWGRQLNTGFIEEAVQWEAYMAYYPVAQKSAIMRIRSLIVMIWFCAKASLQFFSWVKINNKISLTNMRLQWRLKSFLLNPHLLCARICISNFSSPLIPRAIGHSSNWKKHNHLLALDTILSLIMA